MAKKKISIKLFSIMLALLMVIMTGCINTKYPRYDKAAQLKEPYYGSLENGDTYYTPASKSCVADKDRTVLYYNELVLVFTKTDLSDDDINDIAKKAGGEAVGIVSGAIHSIQIKIPAATLGEIELLANELCEDENVM
ncbi:MAG: hypothetical protein J6K92_01600, partial [Oscillospiraceae bacterium]|nr:hypothetical protein [Oscillospiraceae bacterium]